MYRIADADNEMRVYQQENQSLLDNSADTQDYWDRDDVHEE